MKTLGYMSDNDPLIALHFRAIGPFYRSQHHSTALPPTILKRPQDMLLDFISLTEKLRKTLAKYLGGNIT